MFFVLLPDIHFVLDGIVNQKDIIENPMYEYGLVAGNLEFSLWEKKTKQNIKKPASKNTVKIVSSLYDF